ncbi:MAG: 30S ribosomal protein S1 [Oscillospiraceae bacterium]|nr:30S ribosomal protein S1 [Oscillospiraceae bacterium]
MEYMQETNITAPSPFCLESLLDSYENGEVLFARALVYDRGKGLRFNLGGYEAFMPNNEVYLSFEKGCIKEAAIATRVNRFVCFVITDVKRKGSEYIFEISRRKAQQLAYDNYISKLCPGAVIPCCVTHIDRFGVFCDIGYGISALLPIDFISVSRIQSPADRFTVGQNIYACIKSCDANGRIVLTHKELLGTWLENAAYFRAGTTTTGIVRSIESYGIFIELAPNLAGLAESCEGIEIGDVVNVYIKNILPDKMKIKLVIMSTLKGEQFFPEIRYFQTDGTVKHWKYSTENCHKNIETYF